MLKLGILLIMMGLLTGCATTKEKALMASYQDKVAYHKQLQKTEKIQLFKDNVTKLVLTATYLYTPNFEKFDQRDETFIIGLHLEDETEVGMEDIIEIFGIRSADDIQDMRDRQEKESGVAPNSLYEDIKNFLVANPFLNKSNTKIDGQLKKDDEDIETKENDDKVDQTDKVQYGLLLKGKRAIEIKKLDKNDPRLKDIAYVTEWGSYYLVRFEHTDSKRFTLKFKSEKYGEGSLAFAKVAKYIYTKKGF